MHPNPSDQRTGAVAAAAQRARTRVEAAGRRTRAALDRAAPRARVVVNRVAPRAQAAWAVVARRLPQRSAPARPRPGWQVVAAKEFADHLASVRFLVLLVIIGLAGVAAVTTAAGFLRDAASQATEVPSPFLLLFTQSPERIPSFVALVGFLGPLLGIAFGFDAINQERADQTLPRLVAQPIHRDDIVNGKFVAGLAAIGVTLVCLVAVTAGIGIVRMGITPSAQDVARLLLYLVVALLYIGLWLAFALLCSVLLRRAATAALVAIAVWLVLTLFGTLLAGILADAVTSSEASQVRWEHTLSQVAPATLYDSSTAALLNPQVRSVGLLMPEQLDRAVPGTLPLDQSLLVVWPHVTAIAAACTLIFAAAYLAFLRQEVRA